MLSLLLDVGLDDSRLVDGTGFHTLDALERSAEWRPVAETCGPYKKIIDQICSILPWLPEAGVARVFK